MAKHPDYLGTGFATHHNRRLKWDHKVNTERQWPVFSKAE